ncbi:hypothetical protein CI102_13076 [Trichoderma harzianum]|nr:hypothetical protein CI102_13076 [Trichoderma harzianum]
MLKALWRGPHIRLLIKYAPLTDEQFEYAKDHLDEPVFPDRERRPRNPLWKDVICDGAILRRGTDGICSFHLKVPYIKALNIPSKILKELRKVALNFTNDLLTDEDVLHAFCNRISTTLV